MCEVNAPWRLIQVSPARAGDMLQAMGDSCGTDRRLGNGDAAVFVGLTGCKQGRCLGALLDGVEDGVRNNILSASIYMYDHYHDSDIDISVRQMLALRLASILAQPHPRTTSCRFGAKSSPRRC
jgi:hypothetical protein